MTNNCGKTLKLAGLAIAMSLFPGMAIAEYDHQWECILEELQDVQTDQAARIMRRYCQEKHPLQKQEKRTSSAEYDFSLEDSLFDDDIGADPYAEFSESNFIPPPKPSPFWDPENSFECFKKYGKKARSRVAAQIIRNTCNRWYSK